MMGDERRSPTDRRKAPAYPWYGRDYAEDEAVKLMTYEQEGVYRRLLDHQWFHGGLPADVSQVALLVPKVSARRFLKAIWPAMSNKFEVREGRLINQKLERVRRDAEAYREERAAAGRAGAEARWGIHGKRSA